MMQKENQAYFQEENSWFDCIGDIESSTVAEKDTKAKTEIVGSQNGKSSSFHNVGSVDTSHSKGSGNNNEESFKRGRQNLEVDEYYLTQNSSSNDIKYKPSGGKQECDHKDKSSYADKQHIYSKNYRQRKKQQVKSLVEENEFLRKTVRDLQFRLRQIELEINRLKFMPEEKQFTIEQLNSEFMTKVTVIMQKNKQNPSQFKSKYDPTDPFYSEFMETYAKHGFGGTKKVEIMNYYFNQILQAMLRDSERYFCLMCLNAKSAEEIRAFPQYDTLNNVFFDILQPDEDKLKRLNFFQVNLHPMILNIVTACKQFNSKFNNVIKSMQIIHEFMRTNYPMNFDFARMRIVQLQSQFQKQKYTKMMRNLRNQWMDQIKKDISNQNNVKKNVIGTKKKKVGHKDE